MTNIRAPRARGFTLVELVIAMAVAAILASIALPSFADALRRARRVEAVSALLQLQLAQERWRADHPRYSASAADLGVAPQTVSGNYRLTISNADETGYVATATAAALQAGDAHCSTLKVVQRDAQVQHASLDASGAESADARNRCWQ